MKYLIKESQIDKVIFKYLDNQDFIRIEKNNRIYFVNSEGDEYAQIRYDEKDKWCYIRVKLIEEISTFFSMEYSDSKEVIGRWVENTLQMKVTTTQKRELIYLPMVENTLQMKVTTTYKTNQVYVVHGELRIPN
jgi:hypothetical protein